MGESNEISELTQYAKLLSNILGSPTGTAPAKLLAGMLVFSAVCRTYGLEVYGSVLDAETAKLSDEEKVKRVMDDMKSDDSTSRFAKFYMSLAIAAANADGSEFVISKGGESTEKGGSFSNAVVEMSAKLVNSLVGKGVKCSEFTDRATDLSSKIVEPLKEVLVGLETKGDSVGKDDFIRAMTKLLGVVEDWVSGVKPASRAASRPSEDDLSPKEAAYKRDIQALEVHGEDKLRDPAELLRVMTVHGHDPLRPGFAARVTSSAALYALVSGLESLGYVSDKVLKAGETPGHAPGSCSCADAMMRSFSVLARREPGYSAVLVAWPKHGVFSVSSYKCSKSDEFSAAWWDSLCGTPVRTVSDAASARLAKFPAPFIS